MNGMIFNIERNSFVDGPGVRTAVFLKGCNLKCSWCHNPESQKALPEIMFYKDKCTACGACERVCPKKQGECILCGECCTYCPGDAKILCGKKYSADEILKEAEKDIEFYKATGGGVTFSGGECMLQIDFLKEVLIKCKQAGIHTAVDTAGNVPFECFEKIFDAVDLFLYDIKCINEKLHIEETGVSNKKILANLKMLSEKFKGEIIISIPLIPGFNNTDEEMEKIADFANNIRCSGVRILPYHQLGESKYGALNMPQRKFLVPSAAEVEKYKKLFKNII